MFWDVSECVDTLGKLQGFLNGRAEEGSWRRGISPLALPSPKAFIGGQWVCRVFLLQLISPLFHKSSGSLPTLLRPIASHACGEQQNYHLSKTQGVSFPLVFFFFFAE